MDDPNTTTTGILEADEDIFIYTVSDEAIEAAAGNDRDCKATIVAMWSFHCC
jgi:hypothetical protein